jgi:hypothetical protein
LVAATVGDLERGHLKSALQRSKMFRENFLIPVADYPEIAVIASGKTPTLAAIQQDSEAALGWILIAASGNLEMVGFGSRAALSRREYRSNCMNQAICIAKYYRILQR